MTQQVLKVKLAREKSHLASKTNLPLIYLYANPNKDLVDMFPHSVRFKIEQDLAKDLLDYNYSAHSKGGAFSLAEEIKSKNRNFYEALLEIAAAVTPNIDLWGLTPLLLEKHYSGGTGLNFLTKNLNNKLPVDPYGTSSELRIHGQDTGGCICLSCPKVLDFATEKCKPFVANVCLPNLVLSVPAYFNREKESE